MYGHANNAHYYSWFDTVVNEHLIVECGVDVKTAPAIALVVHSECDYFQPVSFPALVDAGTGGEEHVRRESTCGGGTE